MKMKNKRTTTLEFLFFFIPNNYFNQFLCQNQKTKINLEEEEEEKTNHNTKKKVLETFS